MKPRCHRHRFNSTRKETLISKKVGRVIFWASLIRTHPDHYTVPKRFYLEGPPCRGVPAPCTGVDTPRQSPVDLIPHQRLSPWLGGRVTSDGTSSFMSVLSP
jgi:hypothetical protein